MFLTIFFVLVALSFVAFLLLHQGYLIRSQSEAVITVSNGAISHLMSELINARQQREGLDNKAAHLIEVYVDALLQEKQLKWQREEEDRKKEDEYEKQHAVSDEEIQNVKEARAKLERCYGLSHSIRMQLTGADDLESQADELQKLLGEILLKEEKPREDPIENFVAIPMGTETFQPKQVKRFAVRLEKPFRLASVSISSPGGMWLASIEAGSSVLPLERDISMTDGGGSYSLPSPPTYPAGTILKCTFSNASDEPKTVAALLQGFRGGES